MIVEDVSFFIFMLEAWLSNTTRRGVETGVVVIISVRFGDEFRHVGFRVNLSANHCHLAVLGALVYRTVK